MADFLARSFVTSSDAARTPPWIPAVYYIERPFTCGRVERYTGRPGTRRSKSAAWLASADRRARSAEEAPKCRILRLCFFGPALRQRRAGR